MLHTYKHMSITECFPTSTAPSSMTLQHTTTTRNYTDAHT